MLTFGFKYFILLEISYCPLVSTRGRNGGTSTKFKKESSGICNQLIKKGEETQFMIIKLKKVIAHVIKI